MGDVGEHRQSILAIRRGKTVACRRKLQGRSKRLFQKQESLQENLLSKFKAVRMKIPGRMVGEIYVVIGVLRTSGFLQTAQLNV